jgi:Zinc finger, ZZ type
MSKVISYLPSNIPRILINRTIVHPKNRNSNSNNGKEDEGQEQDSDGDTEKDFRDGYIFDAYLLGFCDDVTRLLAKRLFADDIAETTTATTEDEQSQPNTRCQLLAKVRERDALKNLDDSDDNKQSCNNALEEEDVDDDSIELEAHKAELWKFCAVPPERVVLFPGAEPTSGNGYGDDGEDDNSELTFREIAHCDGCAKRIEKTIYKCNACFDYDLCTTCFPKLSKTHCGGGHVFTAEPAAVIDV